MDSGFAILNAVKNPWVTLSRTRAGEFRFPLNRVNQPAGVVSAPMLIVNVEIDNHQR